MDARNHYVDVGKSQLRKPQTASLGPQYRGSKIRRIDVQDDADGLEDDFFAGASGDETDESSGGVAVDQSSSEGDISAEETTKDGIDDTDLTDEEMQSAATRPRVHGVVSDAERRKMRKAMQDDQVAIASSLRQSMKSDAAKGRAVKRQRATFDSFLGARIKLQKTLVGVNTIVGLDEPALAVQQEGADEALAAAETAAFTLWSSLNDLQDQVIAARTGEKRKHLDFTVSTPCEDLWLHMQQQEESSRPQHNAILQRWSAKVRDPSVQSHGRLLNPSTQTPLLDILNQHLANMPHLLSKVHTPRSCAPLQLAQKKNTDPAIYDDADFYGLMLKELLESRASADSAVASQIDVHFDPRREARAKKHVDTKASKGRKLRYTVHEKLQSFMAPEDRCRWGERQTDELFGSLFGKRLQLGEESGEENGDETLPDEALMMFRT